MGIKIGYNNGTETYSVTTDNGTVNLTSSDIAELNKYDDNMQYRNDVVKKLKMYEKNGYQPDSPNTVHNWNRLISNDEFVNAVIERYVEYYENEDYDPNYALEVAIVETIDWCDWEASDENERGFDE